MASKNINQLTVLATPQPTMLMYAGLSPFGVTDDRAISANDLLATITQNITDVSLQWDDGLGTATVSAAGKGKIIYNDTTKVFQYSADGAAYVGFGGTPAAPVNSVQYNNAGAFGGNAGFIYDPASDPNVLLTALGGFTGLQIIEDTAVTSPSFGGFPAMLALQTLNSSTYWGIGYVNSAAPNKYVNYLSTAGDLLFTPIDGTAGDGTVAMGSSGNFYVLVDSTLQVAISFAQFGDTNAGGILRRSDGVFSLTSGPANFSSHVNVLTWATTGVTLGQASTTTGQLTYAAAGSANTQAFQAGTAPAATNIFRWPNADPTVGQSLTASAPAAGIVTLSWTSTGSVSSGTQFQMAYYATTGTAVSGLSNLVTDANGDLSHAATARTGTVTFYNRIVTPADTALTASTESVGIQFGGNTSAATVTRQFATGALTTQRENVFVAPTYSFVGASTLTNAFTVDITGAPTAGTNATITNKAGLRVQGGVTSPGSGSNTETFGLGATTGTNTSSLAIGTGATAGTGNSNVIAIGPSATAIGDGSIAIGGSATSTAVSIAIGRTAVVSATNSINIQTQFGNTVNQANCFVVGSGVAVTAGSQVVFGPFSSVYIGNGVTNASPVSITYNATGGSGSNIAGANLNLFAGKGTGTGIPGTVGVQFARPSASSSTLNTQSEQILWAYATDALNQTWQLKSSTTANRDAANIQGIWTDNTDASRTANFVFSIVNNAVSLAEIFRLNGVGAVAGVSSGGYLYDVGLKRNSSNFTKTSDAALADVTGLSVNTVSGKKYKFEAVLYTTSAVTGGVQFAIAGTTVIAALVYEAVVYQGGLAVATGTQRATALGTKVGDITAVTTAYARITGTITVDTGGTLTVQFAQNASDGTGSIVLANSIFEVNEIP